MVISLFDPKDPRATPLMVLSSAVISELSTVSMQSLYSAPIPRALSPFISRTYCPPAMFMPPPKPDPMHTPILPLVSILSAPDCSNTRFPWPAFIPLPIPKYSSASRIIPRLPSPFKIKPVPSGTHMPPMLSLLSPLRVRTTSLPFPISMQGSFFLLRSLTFSTVTSAFTLSAISITISASSPGFPLM